MKQGEKNRCRDIRKDWVPACAGMTILARHARAAFDVDMKGQEQVQEEG